MAPALRDGDVLRVQPHPAADVAPGDIAVCRGDGSLFAHRVVDTGVQDKRPFIVTRPDRARRGDDAPTFADDLLEVVCAVQRRGRPVPFGVQTPPWPVRADLDLHAALAAAGRSAGRKLAWALQRAQGSTLCGPVACCWWAAARRRVSYVVRVPLRSCGEALYHELPAVEFDPRMVWQGRPVERWTLALILCARAVPAASATLERAGVDAWRVDESATRLRYRGLGLDAAVLCEAEAILTRYAMRLDRAPNHAAVALSPRDERRNRG